MKKVLSLILAALMCAAMTPAVFADEAAPVEAVIEEIAPDDAGIMLISEEEGQIVEEAAAPLVAEEDVLAVAAAIEAADIAKIVEIAAKYGLVFAPEFVEALLLGEVVTFEFTDAEFAVVSALFALEVVEEEVVEETVAEEIAVEEVAVEEAAAIEEVVEEAIEEEIVEEEVSKYPVILEEIPTFSIFTRLLSPFIFRG